MARIVTLRACCTLRVMGFLDDMNRVGEQRHRRKERKHMEASVQQHGSALDVQSAILAELRRLNEQVQWQNNALTGLLRERPPA